ncbi:MAG: DUF1588 domain-containing protein [Myxococcales bacterium]|nr:DUF1588 domain-containing protein [Myxococcales bacterium]
MTTRKTRTRFASCLMMLIGAGLLAGTAGGCSSSAEDEGAAGGACLSNRAFFAQKVWGPVISKTCINCHSPDGVAVEEGAELQLLPPGYPGFLDTNMKALAEMAKIESEGKSVVLRKPLGELDHGGGVQLEPGSKEYEALSALVQRFREAESCPETAATASFPDVDLLGELGTFRKASLQLTGKLPTADEIEELRAGGLDVLPGKLDALFDDPAFYDWLKQQYNDLFLTDRYLAYNGYALNILNDAQFPYASDAYDNFSDEDKARASRAVAREPLELIAYVVKNDLPYSEILTADYTMMNPFSAPMYNAQVDFTDAADETEFKPGHIQAQLDTGMTPWPTAGLLTSPMWLNRFPTTPTNRNRHRARMVMQFFLATDILAVVNRPINAEETAKYQNPTRDDPTCTGCHRQIDPIAGAFQKFDDYDQERYRPDSNWHPEMFPPGFGNDVMQTSDFAQAPAWLAQHLVQDRRFPLSAVHTMFKALTGHAPLAYPADSEAEDFADQLKAWEAQDATFRAIVDKFADSNFNLKTVIREIILSPYYRASGASKLEPQRQTQLSNVGTARFESPEGLSKKIEAVTGFPWTRGWDSKSYLMTDYRILYGGIDSDTITQRLTAPNGVMANVVWRMANEVACSSTAFDFTLTPQGRHLFPYVEPSQAPETETGDSVPDAITDIKKNIQYLHAHFLGEDLALDNTEIERTYQLFYETWKEGVGKVQSGDLEKGLEWRCRARVDRFTGADLPEGQRLEQDENYVIRAWMAVITYLLSDYGFLHD